MGNDARSILGEFVSAGDLSKKRSLSLDPPPTGGEALRRQRGSWRSRIARLRSLDSPSPTEEFESLTSGIASPVSMTLSQDKTILHGELSFRAPERCIRLVLVG